MPTKSAGWPVPEWVKERFTDFCKEVQTLAKGDCAGALYIWPCLPAHLRARAKRAASDQSLDKDDTLFWQQFTESLERVVDHGLLAVLLELGTETNRPGHDVLAGPGQDLYDVQAAPVPQRDTQRQAYEAAFVEVAQILEAGAKGKIGAKTAISQAIELLKPARPDGAADADASLDAAKGRRRSPGRPNRADATGKRSDGTHG